MSAHLTNKFGLTERDMNVFQNTFIRYPEVTKVYIFGSRAKGNFKPGSDIDLAVVNEGVSDKTLLQLANDLDESDLPYKVDILYTPDLQHPELKDHIDRAAIIFYEKAD